MKMRMRAAVALLGLTTLALAGCGGGGGTTKESGGGSGDPAAGYRFRITAQSGTTAVASTALMKDKVDAVNTTGSSLTLELARSGKVAYSAIQAVD